MVIEGRFSCSTDIEIEQFKNYIWDIDTTGLDAGIYCLYRMTFNRDGTIKDERVVLGRKLIIKKSTEDGTNSPLCNIQTRFKKRINSISSSFWALKRVLAILNIVGIIENI